VIVAISLITDVGARLSGLQKLGPLLPPDVLAHRSQEIVENLGYAGQRADWADRFFYDDDFRDYVRKNDKPHPRWDTVLAQRPQVLGYWYRQSPRLLDAEGMAEGMQGNKYPGIVFFDDPPQTVSGMVNLRLDAQGRLTWFQAIPPELEDSPGPARAADWNALFAAAGLDPAQFRAAEPIWISLAPSDARTAWTGTWPGSNRPLRVEAAAWRGKPVFFSLIGPWTKPSRMQESTSTPGQKVAYTIYLTGWILVVVGGVLLARRNYVRGKGDLRGAFRIACAVLVIQMATWLCFEHPTSAWATFGRSGVAISGALLLSGLAWVWYIALEPYVRRHWPQAIISWSRLVAGRLRDPLVGRDILLGVVLGTAWVLLFGLLYLVHLRAGHAPQMGDRDYLLGTKETLGTWLLNALNVLPGLVFFFLLFLLRVVLRRTWLAVVTFVAILILTAMGSLSSVHDPAALRSELLAAMTTAIFFSTLAVALVRFGLVVTIVGLFVSDVFQEMPYTLDFSNWYASRVFVVILSVIALAAWGFYTSLGGQRLLKGELFE